MSEGKQRPPSYTGRLRREMKRLGKKEKGSAGDPGLQPGPRLVICSELDGAPWGAMSREVTRS